MNSWHKICTTRVRPFRKNCREPVGYYGNSNVPVFVIGFIDYHLIQIERVYQTRLCVKIVFQFKIMIQDKLEILRKLDLIFRPNYHVTYLFTCLWKNRLYK